MQLTEQHMGPHDQKQPNHRGGQSQLTNAFYRPRICQNPVENPHSRQRPRNAAGARKNLTPHHALSSLAQVACRDVVGATLPWIFLFWLVPLTPG